MKYMLFPATENHNYSLLIQDNSRLIRANMYSLLFYKSYHDSDGKKPILLKHVLCFVLLIVQQCWVYVNISSEQESYSWTELNRECCYSFYLEATTNPAEVLNMMIPEQNKVSH